MSNQAGNQNDLATEKENLKLGGGRLLMRKTNNSNMAHISKVKKMLSFKNTIL